MTIFVDQLGVVEQYHILKRLETCVQTEATRLGWNPIATELTPFQYLVEYIQNLQNQVSNEN